MALRDIIPKLNSIHLEKWGDGVARLSDELQPVSSDTVAYFTDSKMPWIYRRFCKKLGDEEKSKIFNMFKQGDESGKKKSYDEISNDFIDQLIYIDTYQVTGSWAGYKRYRSKSKGAGAVQTSDVPKGACVYIINQTKSPRPCQKNTTMKEGLYLCSEHRKYANKFSSAVPSTTTTTATATTVSVPSSSSPSS